MYATCIFCTRRLGRNETIETFPVGRRLAFDAAKGRLWAVCSHCGRWNLSPLEERWEAIEACERAYRGTRLRSSTANIGLARLVDGTDLIRIGAPERPEIAAWRYGSTFARRHRRYAGAAIGLTAAAPIAFVSGVAFAAAAPVMILAACAAGWVSAGFQTQRVVARINERNVFTVAGASNVRSAQLVMLGDDDASWGIALQTDIGIVRLVGERAHHAAAVLLAHFNQLGGHPEQVQNAVARLDAAGSSDALFARTAAELEAAWNETPLTLRYGEYRKELRWVPNTHRLALEMAVHEETERRALHGELKALEVAWKEAEQVAEIADNLLLPDRVRAFLEKGG